MPLIRCPHCGSEVSDAAQFCPACEWPLKAERSRRRFAIVGAVLFVLFVLYMSYDISRQGSIVDTLFEGNTQTAILIGFAVLVWLIGLAVQIWATRILRVEYPDVWKKHFVSKRVFWPNEYCELGNPHLAVLVRIHRASTLMFFGLMAILVLTWA